MIKKKSGGKWRWFPGLVSSNPKKVIAGIIIFTLIMGIFASQMQMGTEEESFNPETPKADYLDEVRAKFGSDGESVQVAFIADDEDVFTKEVLNDMLDVRKAILNTEKINSTLLSSPNSPSGVNTLADTVLTADQTLLIEEGIIDYSNKTEGMVSTVDAQSQMYTYMNQSLSSSAYMMDTSNPTVSSEVAENGTQALVAMSKVISKPKSWGSLTPYQTNITQMMMVLSGDSDLSTKIVQTETVITQMEQSSDPDLRPFITLLDSMNNIMIKASNNETPVQNAEIAIGMSLSFLRISEHIQSISSSMDLNPNLPSFQLSEQDKIDKLGSMDDEDVKQTVKETIQYDPKPLRNSVNRSIDNLDDIDENVSSNIQTLDHMENTLNRTISTLRSSGFSEPANTIEKYFDSVSENRTNLQQMSPFLNQIQSQFKSASYLPSVIEGLGRSFKISTSKDFENLNKQNLQLSDIKANSAIGLVKMNISIDDEKRLEAQKEIIDIGDKEAANSEVKVFAGQVMIEEIDESANESLNTLLPIAFIFVVFVLLLVYRAVVETILSIFSLVCAIVWTFGIGVLLGYEFNPMIIAVPVLITGLVIDYGIHMVMRIREERDDGYSPKDSIVIAILTVGGALLLTTMTTAIGFLSNTFSNISVMRNFGILAAVGIVSSFILMVGFLPAVVQLVEEWRERRDKEGGNIAKKVKKQGSDIISSILTASTDASDKHPVVVLIVVLLITSTAVYGAFNVDTTFDIQDFLPEDKSQSKNIQYISNHFNISTSYAYILTKGDLTSEDYLIALERTEENMKDDEMLLAEEGLSSPLTVLRTYGTATIGSSSFNSTIVSAFDQSDTDGDMIPDQNIEELYDLLFEADVSKSSIERVLEKNEDGEYRTAVIRVKENAEKLTADMANAAIMEKEMKEDSKPLRDGGYVTRITSSNIIGQETTEELNSTQLKSLVATIIIVGILLTIVFYFVHKSKVLGLITTIPVTLVTLWIVGTMYLVGVPLNVMTVSITALTVGMGIDYSIHITHRFTEEKKEDGNNLYQAMHNTIQNTGAALFGSAATTMGAFGILSTSAILPLAQFGYITALAIGYSFLVAVFVLPSALMLWAKCCEG